MTEDLDKALRFQAKACDTLGSPFNGALCAALADDVAAGGAARGLFAPWAAAPLRQLIDDAVALRALAALHDLALSGEAPELSAAYPAPGRETSPAGAWLEAQRAIRAHEARLARFMAHEPQTNEVRRSVCLLGGFLTVAAETRLPLRTFELGASAGLNLSWDRFGYDLGEGRWGDPASPVQLDTQWTGSLPPLNAPVTVISRAACDRRPTDLADPEQERRLLAYLWPDQFERLARARAAIALARRHGVQVETADAAEWAGRIVTLEPSAATVLYHSVFWQYLPAETQAALQTAIDRLAANATSAAPFAWLRMEPPADAPSKMEVRLTLWPGGEDRRLAQVHPHGARVAWDARA